MAAMAPEIFPARTVPGFRFSQLVEIVSPGFRFSHCIQIYLRLKGPKCIGGLRSSEFGMPPTLASKDSYHRLLCLPPSLGTCQIINYYSYMSREALVYVLYLSHF